LKDIALRPAGASDEIFLRRLFASTRENETNALPPEYRPVFLEHQFEAQRTFYHSQFPEATHDIILRGADPIGRLWVDRQPDAMLIVDIAVIPEFRGQGIGTLLLEELIREAKSASKVLRIHVEQFNPALRLYERLGFRIKESNGVYFLLDREPT
jgi:ribosomal protein S18 acetylase RimI-like enzyme